MASTTTRFLLQPDPQVSSDLLQLPAELRMIIVRFLMETEESFKACRHHPAKYTWWVLCNCLCGYRYSAQLLATCQILYREGGQILYQANTLEIFFTPGEYKSLRCSVLSYQTNLPLNISDSSYDQSHLCSSLDRLSVFWRNSRGKAALTTLKKFSRYEVRIDQLAGYRQENVVIVCRLLKEILLMKHVTFIIKTPTDIIPTGIAPVYLLYGCKFLRCASIRFPGYQAENVAQITDIITNERPNISIDTYRAWHLIKTSFIDDLPDIHGFTFEEHDRYVLIRLLDILYAYDLADFLEKQMLVMESAKYWIRRWMRHCMRHHEDYDSEEVTHVVNAYSAANDIITPLISSCASKPTVQPADLGHPKDWWIEDSGFCFNSASDCLSGSDMDPNTSSDPVSDTSSEADSEADSEAGSEAGLEAGSTSDFESDRDSPPLSDSNSGGNSD